MVTANTYVSIGDVFKTIGEYAKSLSFFEKELRIQDDLSGYKSPDIIQTIYWIGAVYEQMGELEKSMDRFDEVLFLLEQEYGADHQNVVSIKEKIADLRQRIEPVDKVIETETK